MAHGDINGKVEKFTVPMLLYAHSEEIFLISSLSA
jgi:hypothetical protein